MFNSAYTIGGAACAVKTVESISGLRMDHYLEVDFTGFKKLINELGGVEITTTKAINDADSHLNLQAGTHTLNGEQALGLVRTRHGVGDGSDLGRIQLQQAFIKALMNQVKNIGVLSQPHQAVRPRRHRHQGRHHRLRPDSVSELSGLAKGLKGIGSENIDMVTLPVDVRPGRTRTV